MNKHQRNILNKVAINYSVPLELVNAIIGIETTYRKWYHRFIENFLVIVQIAFYHLLGTKIRNFTIGHCQIGIASILLFNGRNIYRHCRFIPNLEKGDTIKIIQAMRFEQNVTICINMLEKFYLKEVMQSNDIDIVFRRVGENYNGSYSYGLMVNQLCQNS